MLKYNKCLEHINLLYNGMGTHVGATLVDALHANTTLRKLQVMYDGLSTEGGGALANMVVHNNTLEVWIDLMVWTWPLPDNRT